MQSIFCDSRTPLVQKLHECDVLLGGDEPDLVEIGVPECKNDSEPVARDKEGRRKAHWEKRELSCSLVNLGAFPADELLLSLRNEKADLERGRVPCTLEALSWVWERSIMAIGGIQHRQERGGTVG